MSSYPSNLLNTGDIHCYVCGHAYDHLGRDDPPGRCPACESHAVDVVEPITVERAEGYSHTDGRSLVFVSISDVTGRNISFEFTLDEQREQAVLDAAWFLDDPVSPDRDGWGHGIVPDLLREKMRDRGYEVVLAQVGPPTRSE